MLPMEGHAHGTQEETGIFVVCRGRADHDVDAGQHSGGVAVAVG